MKRIFATLFAAFCSTLVIAKTYDIEVDGICYNIVGNEAVVTVFSDDIDINARHFSGEITIPESIIVSGKRYPVTTIGPKAFSYCSNVTAIYLPDNVTTISSEAFKGNTLGVEKLHLGANVKEIANNAFSWAWISNLEIDATNPYYIVDGNVFYSADHKRAISVVDKKSSKEIEVELHDNVEQIDDGFAYGRRIRSIHFGPKLKSIGEEAFYWSFREENCLQTSLNLPDGITHIGEKAFMGCHKINDLHLPDSLTRLQRWSFSGVNPETIHMPKNLKVICDYALSTDPSHVYKNLVLPEGLDSIGINGITDICKDSLIVPASVRYLSSGSLSNHCKYVEIKAPLEVIPAEAIPSPAAKEIVLPKTVRRLERLAFDYPYKLERITWPDSLEYIGDWVFAGCRINPLVVPSTVKTLGTKAFADNIMEARTYYFSSSTPPVCLNTDVFEGIVFQTSTLYVPRGSKNAYASKAPWSWFGTLEEYDEIVLPPVTYRYDFECDGLFFQIVSEEELTCRVSYDIGFITERNTYTHKSLTIPSTATFGGKTYTVVGIEPRSFADTPLRNVSLPNTITDLSEAFRDCITLTSVELPESVTNISGAFESCVSLKSIQLHDNITDISRAFRDCSSLESIQIPANISNITGAFDGCAKLESIVFPDHLTEIGESTCARCFSLKSVKLPASLQKIGYYAFGWCPELKSILLPAKVEFIKEAAFADDWDLTEVISLNPVPPYSDGRFSPFQMVCGTLHVPAGSKSAYQNEAMWQYYTIIEDAEEIVSSIGQLSANPTSDKAYDILGRPVNGNYRGIVIKNGKLIQR